VSWRDVFVEVPIKVHNSSLAQALIADINPAVGATAADLERLNLGSAPYISKTMGNLIDCLDDLVGEQQKVGHKHPAAAACS
jgi:translation initiation factor 3 subunit H